MSEFVEQCRREWRRLGVADPLADEMASDLATDLGEAEAEGVSAEELLGSSVFDPRSFAASWAAARGVIPEPQGRGDDRRRPTALLVFTVVALIVLVVAALLLLTGQPKLSIVTRTTSAHVSGLPVGPGLRPGTAHKVVSTSASAPVEWILLVFAIVALGLAAWLWSRWGRSRAPATPVR
jgi:hypothetical protein